MTPELMRKDIDTVADCVLDYMNNDELTVMGMSWGSKYAGDYAARYSEKVDCFIGTSIALDEYSDAYINRAILDYSEGRIDFCTAIGRKLLKQYGYDRIAELPDIVKDAESGMTARARTNLPDFGGSAPKELRFLKDIPEEPEKGKPI